MGDVALDNIVAQDHTYQLTVYKVFGQSQGVGDAALSFLIGII